MPRPNREAPPRKPKGNGTIPTPITAASGKVIGKPNPELPKPPPTVSNGVPAKANPEPTPTRIVAWKWRHPSQKYGVLRILADRVDAFYFVRQLQLNLFQLEKLEDASTMSYLVTIGGVSHCGCKGFTHHGGCKHVDALTSLRKRLEL